MKLKHHLQYNFLQYKTQHGSQMFSVEPWVLHEYKKKNKK